MTPAALFLVLLAAALHAGWNYLAKSAHDTGVFLWWAILIGALGYGAYILLTAPIALPQQVWVLYALSISAEVGYVITLVLAYQDGDLSLVYPLARGTGPIFVALWSALFVSERLPLLGYLGIALMVTGIFVVSWQPRFVPTSTSAASATADSEAGIAEERARNQRIRGTVLWALASSVFFSIYSVLDKQIVAAMSPLVYNFWVYAGIAVGWGPFVWIGRENVLSRNIRELRDNWPRVVLGSIMTIGAYVTVLVALTQASASYVVAGRGTSVIIGALLGWLALHEGFGWLRVIGSILMVAGLAVIAFA